MNFDLPHLGVGQHVLRSEFGAALRLPGSSSLLNSLSKMARRNSQQSVSLFPFLAVLVCTMGALILLLLVTTRRMRQEQARYTAAVEVLDDLTNGDLPDSDSVSKDDFVLATAELQASPKAERATDAEATEDAVPQFPADWLPDVDDSVEQHDELQRQIKVAKARQEELLEQNVDLEKVLSDQQTKLTSVTEEIHDAEVELLTTGREVRQLDEAESELKALRSEKDDLELQISQQERMLAGVQAELEEKSAFTEDAEAVLSKRESALVSLRRLVAKSSENLAQGSSASQLEFTNTEGTARVPIVINVDEEGFTFQPTGITVTENDLKGFPGNDNPLLAGIQAAAALRSEGLLVDDAYVLLLVRPSGSLAFYKAQQIMTNANIHFGYELLEADRAVELGQSNPEEVQVVRQSILEALNRRSELYGALLAAQQTRSNRREGTFNQQSRIADARSQSAGRSDRGDRRGADGRTLQELMDLGRVYAAGEPKPDPKVQQYLGRRDQRGQWADSGRRAANAVPMVQSPAANSQQTAQGEKASETIGNLPQIDGSQVAGIPGQASEMNGFEGSVQAGGNGTEHGKLAHEFRPERSSKLSENMGLNGQLSAAQMPNPTLAEQPSGGQLIANESVRDRISPDVDWSSVEAAPQHGGTRPVDSELLSAFAGVEDGSPQSDSPSQQPTASDFQSEAFFEDFAGTQQSPAQPFDSEQPSFQQPDAQQQQPSVAGVPRVRPPMTDAAPPINGQSGPSGSGNPGSGQPGAGSGRPADPQLSYLQQFLDEVEQQRSQEIPNAELLRLLRRAQNSPQGRMSDNLASPGITQPTQQVEPKSDRKSVSQTAQLPDPPSTAPESAKPKQDSQPVYYVIRVYVSDSKLVVGPFEPIDISGWSDQQVAEAAFTGVSATMKDVWAEVRKDALPAVRFLVAEGSQQRSQITSQQLQKLEIPTRAIQLEGRDLSLKRFFSDDLPPTNQSSTGRSPEPIRPANPSNRSQQQPSTTSGRRTSI